MTAETPTPDDSWYEPVTDGRLEQGDVLLNFPVVLVPDDVTFPAGGNEGAFVDVEILDVVILTQTCDIENDKLDWLILCPHYDFNATPDPALRNRNTVEEIRKGRRPRYVMLDACRIPETPMEIRIVDCGRVLSLPKRYVLEFAATQTERVRLRSPYREHLSQSFASFFMRVALPFTVPEIKNL